jgi:signal transduction histidine kinase
LYTLWNIIQNPYASDAVYSIEINKKMLFFEIQRTSVHLNFEEHELFLIKDVTETILSERNKNEKYYQELLLLSASHELRTPLNASIQMGELIEPYVTHPEGKKYLRILKNSSRLMIFLVNDMLDLYQIKAGKLTLNIQGFKIRDLVESTLDTFIVQCEHKNVLLLNEI